MFARARFFAFLARIPGGMLRLRDKTFGTQP
jgi:hypothetical protein